MAYIVKKKIPLNETELLTVYTAPVLFSFEDVRDFEKWIYENTSMTDGHVEDLLEELSQNGVSTVYADFNYLDSEPVKPKYNDLMDPEQQVGMEETVAAMIFDFAPTDAPDLGIGEEDVADLSKEILLTVLTKFRPDLVKP